jgi:hypothetical protein
LDSSRTTPILDPQAHQVIAYDFYLPSYTTTPLLSIFAQMQPVRMHVSALLFPKEKTNKHEFPFYVRESISTALSVPEEEKNQFSHTIPPKVWHSSLVFIHLPRCLSL